MTIINQMARTSVANGADFEKLVRKTFIDNGWQPFVHKKVHNPFTGSEIKPDMALFKYINGQRLKLIVECKSNGEIKGTTYEKWMYGIHKNAVAARELQAQPVVVINDRSNKLTKHINNELRPFAALNGTVLLTLEELDGYAKG